MKRRFLVLILIVITISISLLLYHSISMTQRQNHIFCELLTSGMSKEQVLGVIGQFGSLDYNISTFGNSYFEIYLGYIDPQVVGRKTYILVFSNDVLSGIGYIKGFDHIETLCNP